MNQIKNGVNLIGRIGIDPIVRTQKNGVKLAKFPLAINETIQEAEGRVQKTQWHQIVAWGSKAELIEKYVSKGQMLAIDGKLVNRVFNDKTTGVTRKITEVQVNEILVITPKKMAS
ncbi:MAG: single-stranded DNA-binding protein [Crocinitomicaceae bacterium]|nr:single-stranded DNA-binding protein [Crocinitomicaceae bacterium]